MRSTEARHAPGERTQLGAGQAPAKAILFGEHAVVYGRPALAVPVDQVQALATVETGTPGGGLCIWAEDLGKRITLRTARQNEPLAALGRLVLAGLGLAEPDWLVRVHSTIPIASGLGSGAAVSTAVVRALAQAAGSDLSPAQVSSLVYEVEKLHHGTPSGVDNTVIAYGQPVYFVRGQQPQRFPIGQSFWLVIADSGVRSQTAAVVGDVRRRWLSSPDPIESLFSEMALIAEAARAAIAEGRPAELGPLMDENQHLLADLGVSCPVLDRLVEAARAAGAGGAKLSGAGWGGNLIALVSAATAAPVAAALVRAGAAQAIITQVGEPA